MHSLTNEDFVFGDIFILYQVLPHCRVILKSWLWKKNHKKLVFWKTYYSITNPFSGDFDLPNRICLNGLFWFSFDKVRHFFYQHFQLWWIQLRKPLTSRIKITNSSDRDTFVIIGHQFLVKILKKTSIEMLIQNWLLTEKTSILWLEI
jgi:hypothetical protein